MLRKPLVQSFSETYRRVRSGGEERFHLFVLGHHPAISRRIFLRKLCEFLAGAIHVAPLGDVASVWEGKVHDGIRVEILEPVLSETQFIIAKNGTVLNQDMRRRAHVVLE